MRLFSVHVDRNTLSQSRNGQIAGRISIGFGESYFPELTWSDAVVVILATALKTIDRLCSEGGAKESVAFFDGPFRMTFEVQGRGRLRIDAIHRDIVRWSESFDVVEVQREFLEAARDVGAECKRRSWTSPEVRELEGLLKERESKDN